MATDDVVTEVVLDDGSASSRDRRTMLRLSWQCTDPLAVVVILVAQPDHPALPRGKWVILRDFLRYGMDEATGDGLVRIRPDTLGDRIWLQLAREGRPCSVSLPIETVRAFLDETEMLVPTGEERSEDALDALIERLLAT